MTKIKGSNENEIEVVYYPQDGDVVSILNSGPWVENYVQGTSLHRAQLPELIAALQRIVDQ